MACEDQISTQDLENAKTDQVTLGEVATSRAGAVSTGDPITTSTNRFGETTDTLQGRLNKLGVIYDDPIRNWTPSLLVSDLRAHRYPATTGDVYIPVKPLPFTTGATFNTDDWVLNSVYADSQIEDALINDLSQTINLSVAEYKALTKELPVGKKVYVTDRDADFTVISGTGTSNDDNIVASDEVSQSIVYTEKEVLPSGEFGLETESGTPANDNTASLDNLITNAKTNSKVAKVDHGNLLVDNVDLENFNVGTFNGYGKDATTFYANSTIPLGAFIDAGFDASDTVHPSSIQHGNIGGFTVRTNGNAINYGASFDQYRRGKVSDIRLVGNDAADELENGFKFNYSWNSRWDNLFAIAHYGNGFEFRSLALNAATFTNLSAASERPTATNFYFDGANTCVLVSPSSEGGVAKGFDYGNFVRNLTIINCHTEGALGAHVKGGSDTNGMNLTLLGGASFNAPNALNFSGVFTDLNITGYGIYDITLADLDIQINARNTVINNLTVVDSDKTKATNKQIRDSITLGSNVETCVVDGVDIAALYRREEFAITIDPGTPQILQSKYLDDMERRLCDVSIAQRTSSSAIRHFNATVTVNSNDTINVDTITERPGVGALVITYDTFNNMLQVDGTIAGAAKVIMSHYRP